MASRTREITTERLPNLPPKKLSYKGCTYILAKTRDDVMWENIAKLLTTMRDIAQSNAPSVYKRDQIAPSYQELKLMLKDLGVDF